MHLEKNIIMHTSTNLMSFIAQHMQLTIQPIAIMSYISDKQMAIRFCQCREIIHTVGWLVGV